MKMQTSSKFQDFPRLSRILYIGNHTISVVVSAQFSLAETLETIRSAVLRTIVDVYFA